MFWHLSLVAFIFAAKLFSQRMSFSRTHVVCVRLFLVSEWFVMGQRSWRLYLWEYDVNLWKAAWLSHAVSGMLMCPPVTRCSAKQRTQSRKRHTSPRATPEQLRVTRGWHWSEPTYPVNLSAPMERYLLTSTYTYTCRVWIASIFRKDNRIRSIYRRGIGIWLTLLSCHSMHSVTTCAQWRGASSSWRILLPEEMQCIMG